MLLQGQAALVTGAGGGLGQAFSAAIHAVGGLRGDAGQPLIERFAVVAPQRRAR